MRDPSPFDKRVPQHPLPFFLDRPLLDGPVISAGTRAPIEAAVRFSIARLLHTCESSALDFGAAIGAYRSLSRALIDLSSQRPGPVLSLILSRQRHSVMSARLARGHLPGRGPAAGGRMERRHQGSCGGGKVTHRQDGPPPVPAPPPASTPAGTSAQRDTGPAGVDLIGLGERLGFADAPAWLAQC